MASIDVEVAACSASPVDLRIGCSGRNLKFPLDMHSINVGYRRPKALCARASRLSSIATEERAVLGVSGGVGRHEGHSPFFHRVATLRRRDARFFPGASDGNQERKNSRTARHRGRGFPSALRRTAYATATITFASHEANAPILTPDIPAMIAAATMALIATQTPQRRSALR